MSDTNKASDVPSPVNKMKWLLNIASGIYDILDKTYGKCSVEGDNKPCVKFPWIFKCCAIGILILVVVNTIIGPVFYMLLRAKLLTGSLVKNQLNNEAVEYNTTRAMNGSVNRYSTCVIVPGLIVILSIYILAYFKTKSNVVCVFAAAMALYGIVCCCLNAVLYFSNRAEVRKSNEQYSAFNAYCMAHLPVQRAAFLRQLENAPMNTNQQDSNLNQALLNLVRDDETVDTFTMSSEDLAKVYFAINLHLHYCKIGVFGDNRKSKALLLFSPGLSILPSVTIPNQSDPPFTDFLFMSHTQIINVGSTYSSSDIFKNISATTKTEAASLCAEWTTYINGLALKFYPEPAFQAIQAMLLKFAVVQLIPAGLIFLIITNSVFIKIYEWIKAKNTTQYKNNVMSPATFVPPGYPVH